MPPPPTDRRTKIADAGLALVAREGLRGLTHRAVDAEAGLPAGTCSNYHRTRDALITALAERLFARLVPDDAEVAAAIDAPPTRELWVRLMVDLVHRVRAHPELYIALWELRLEATRRPDIVDPLTSIVRRSFELDVANHERSGLAGTVREVQLVHLAINGLILETLTLPNAIGIADDQIDATIETLVDRIIATPEPGN